MSSQIGWLIQSKTIIYIFVVWPSPKLNPADFEMEYKLANKNVNKYCNSFLIPLVLRQFYITQAGLKLVLSCPSLSSAVIVDLCCPVWLLILQVSCGAAAPWSSLTFTFTFRFQLPVVSHGLKILSGTLWKWSISFRFSTRITWNPHNPSLWLTPLSSVSLMHVLPAFQSLSSPLLRWTDSVSVLILIVTMPVSCQLPSLTIDSAFLQEGRV